MDKGGKGRFFEDFEVGRVLRHAGPRTVTAADAALYLALTGSRFALQAAEPLARAWGLPAPPLDDLLVFHLVFGLSVPDLSVNAIANLGYADGRFLAPVFPGDTLVARSTVIGLKQTSSGKSGIVWVRTEGFKTCGTAVLDYVRWVLVNKRDPASPAPEPVVPELPAVVAPDRLVAPPGPAPRLRHAYERRLEALRVAEERDHELGRPVLRARLLDTQRGTEADLLPDLSDARLLWAENNRLRFAGFERVDNANYAQTWEVEVAEGVA